MEIHKAHTTGENAVKLVGEAFVPGASLLMDGKILAGGAHLILGHLAGMALGPVGLALVIANSYATSTTGKSLLKQFTKDDPAPPHNGEARVVEHRTEVKTEHKKAG